MVCDRLIRSLGVTAEHDDDVAVLVVQHPARTGANAELFHNAALDLLGGIEAAPRARAFATGVLTSWRFPVELRDLGVLATSELVANSLQHGTPPMRLGLRRTDRRLIIEVTDGDDHLPRRRQSRTGRRGGTRDLDHRLDRHLVGQPPHAGRWQGGLVRDSPCRSETGRQGERAASGSVN